MQVPRPNCPRAPIQTRSQAALPSREREYTREHHTGGNGCPLEVGDLAAALREFFSGHIEAGKATDATAYEVDKRQPVPAGVQSCSESERRGRHSKRNDVGERIELSTQRRVRLSPARDTT